MDTPTSPEQEIETENVVPDQNTQATPEELGVGQRQSNEPFSPVDFEKVVDGAFGAIQNEKASEVVESEKQEEPVENKGEDNQQNAESQDKTEEVVKPVADLSAEPEKNAEETQIKDKPDTASLDKEVEAIEAKMGPHASTKTKKLFNEVKGIAAKERAEREKISSELAELRKQYEEAKKTATGVPDDVKKEMEEMRDRIRQFDINSDPSIVNKYDKTIAKNNDSIITTLVNAGLPKEHADKLKKSGVTLNNLRPYLETLETGKGADGKQYDADPDTAEIIRESLRENIRLSREKEKEISDWRTNYETRTKQQEEQNKVAVENASKRLSEQFQSHVSKWDFLKKPAEVQDSDVPAVRKQKEEAIRAFNDTALKFAEAIKNETANPLDAQIAARVGILYRDHVAPQLHNKLQAAQKEIDALKTQINSMKKSGSSSKSIGSSTPRAAQRQEAPANEGFDDALDALASMAMQQKQEQ